MNKISKLLICCALLFPGIVVVGLECDVPWKTPTIPGLDRLTRIPVSGKLYMPGQMADSSVLIWLKHDGGYLIINDLDKIQQAACVIVVEHDNLNYNDTILDFLITVARSEDETVIVNESDCVRLQGFLEQCNGASVVAFAQMIKPFFSISDGRWSFNAMVITSGGAVEARHFSGDYMPFTIKSISAEILAPGGSVPLRVIKQMNGVDPDVPSDRKIILSVGKENDPTGQPIIEPTGQP